MPKEKILEAYLNEIPLRGKCLRDRSSQQDLFNKDAQDLTLAEAAYLASIPQSPTTLSPYGKNRDKLEARKNFSTIQNAGTLNLSLKQNTTAQKMTGGVSFRKPLRGYYSAAFFFLALKIIWNKSMAPMR